VALDNVVAGCIDSDAAACDFCLAGMSNGDSARAIGADWSAPACQSAGQFGLAAKYLDEITTACPYISACRHSVTDCIFSFGTRCLVCINGSTLQPIQAAFCSELSLSYSFDHQCQPCPASVHTINLVVLATATVGGASAAACIAVATTIVAHGRDCTSMRDRIVVGLMMANAEYSTANAIPLNALRTGVVDCGHLAMSFDAIRFWACVVVLRQVWTGWI
jgi:hypothetical protein